MYPKIIIKELRPLYLEGGFLIDGFPSMGFSSVIATESIIHTSHLKLAGIIDSDVFPSISLIKDGKPNFPTRIFVNDDLKIAAFLSHIAVGESLHRNVAKKMLTWAKDKNIILTISSVSVKGTSGVEEIMAIGSTENATKKIKKAGLKVLEFGTIPGIPGMLLNEGSITNQDVIVILFQSEGTGPDFKSGAQLCNAISKLIPGAACDIPTLQAEAQKVEQIIKKDLDDTQHLDSMYR